MRRALRVRSLLPGLVALIAVVLIDTGSANAPPGPRAAGGSCPAGEVASRHRVAILGRGSWSWFADPRAVRLVGPRAETVVGWIDPAGRVTVAAIDTRCGVEQSSVVGRLFHDDHGNPALLVEPDGRLTAFWSGHDGPTMFFRTTISPGDVSAWGPVRRIQPGRGGDYGFTYPNPVLLSGEGQRLYLFWRGSDWSADYATRTPDGRWSGARRLIRNPGERPYVKVDSRGGGRIAFAFTDGHPRNMTTSIYYASYSRGWLRHAGGRPIARLGSRPIRPRDADRVYSGAAQHASGWVWDVALDSRQRPVIVYATFRSVSNHEYWYARWSGHRWISHPITFAGPTISPRTIETEYSGGLVLDHQNPSIVYLSRRVRGRFEIERWRTRDGGRHWRHRTVFRTAGADALRPAVPRGPARDQIRLLWLQGHYGSYSNYRTSIAYLR